MKMLSYFLPFACSSLLNLQGFSQSQSNIKTIKPPTHNIMVDGNLQDWGDSLSYYNPAKRINYGLASDKENLYFAVRIQDREQQGQAMRNGITLAFNPEGKKKETYSLTFPYPDENSMFIMPKTDNAITGQQLKQENIEDRRKAELLKLRDIGVKGFKDVETEHISTDNTYGIKAVLNIDEKEALVYELAIPIKMLHADNLNSKPWIFDIKINSFTAAKDSRDGLRPSDGSGGGMRGGGMNGGGIMGGDRRGGGGGRMGNMGGGQNTGFEHSGQGKAIEIKDKFVW